MNKQEIVSVLRELHKICGFRVSLHGADYSEIAAYPEEKSRLCRLIHADREEFNRCAECDRYACGRALTSKETYIYRCRYGMLEAVSPLYNFGTLTGFLMMGQVVSESEAEELSRRIGSAFGQDSEQYRAVDGITEVRADMIDSYVKIMTICAEYLTLSNAVFNDKPTVAQMARKFILDHYSERIGIKEICAGVGCSKSTLVTAFRREHGVTVNAFITEVRLSEAIKMMRLGELSVGEIAISCGFSDQSYFSKVFSAHYGMPPSVYQGKMREIAE